MRNQADGNTIARPITEYFLRKILADKKSGIEKGARFVKPAELENQINSADIIISDYDPSPAGEGVDQGVGNPEDYNIYTDSIGAESKDYSDDDTKTPPPPKKDTASKTPIKKEEEKKVPGKKENRK